MKKPPARKPVPKPAKAAETASKPVKTLAPAVHERPESARHDEESKITLDDLRHDMGLSEPMEEEEGLSEDLPLEDDEDAGTDYLDKPEEVADDEEDE